MKSKVFCFLTSLLLLSSLTCAKESYKSGNWKIPGLTDSDKQKVSLRNNEANNQTYQWEKNYKQNTGTSDELRTPANETKKSSKSPKKMFYRSPSSVENRGPNNSISKTQSGLFYVKSEKDLENNAVKTIRSPSSDLQTADLLNGNPVFWSIER